MFNQVVWIFVLSGGLLFATSGCSTVLTVAYLFHPEDVPAEYNELRGKHVVIVCKPIVELEFTDAGTARELADRIGANIRENVRGVKIISQQEVSRWIDENAWVDYATLGEAVDADIVVGIHMQVHDVKEDLIVFDKRMDDFTFPGDSAIPTADQSEQQFRGLFLRILSSRLARCFYAYESRDHFAEENLIY